MELDERLPEALREAVGTLPPELGDWGAVSALGRHRRDRRRRIRRGVGVLVLVVAVSIGIGIAVRSPDTQPAVKVTHPSPSSVVAVTGNRLVVLSASDGHLLRTLVTAPSGRFLGQIAVNSKTRHVYYTLGRQCAPPREIWQIPIGGGTPHRVVKNGSAPAVSPDGHFLAYASSLTTSPTCFVHDTLAIQDLRTGKEHRTQLGGQAFGVLPVSWWPDSHRVEVTVGSDFQTVRVEADGLRVLTTIRLFGNGFVFLPSHEAITALPGTTTSRLVAFDPATGVQRRTLAVLNQPLVLLGSDPSGTILLLSTLATETSGSPTLYRAAPGATQPTALASNTAIAAWLP